MAEARIVEDDLSDPMMPGDQIFSPTWEPGRAEHFALAGFMDIDGDGESDRQRIHDLITLNGGVIDAEVTDDGKKTGKMSINTKYLILGDEPKGEGKPLTAYSEMNERSPDARRARRSTVNEFLDYMGYKPEERTVQLGKTSTSSDFKPRLPEDVQRTSHGRGAADDLRRVPKQRPRAVASTRRRADSRVTVDCRPLGTRLDFAPAASGKLEACAPSLALASSVTSPDCPRPTARCPPCRFRSMPPKCSSASFWKFAPGCCKSPRRSTGSVGPKARSPTTRGWPRFARPWRFWPTAKPIGPSESSCSFRAPYDAQWQATLSERADGQSRLIATARALDRHAASSPCTTSIRTFTWSRASPTTTRRWPRWAASRMSEPAFWAGFDRGSVDGFRDYFRQLTEFEPKRAGWYGIQHYTWLCINAKEAENVSLSREVIAMIPEFLDQPGVLGIGEIGLNKNTKNEATIFLEHLDLAAKTDEQILIHTPHLEDKYQGTRMILDMLCDDRRLDHSRVLVDHVEEHTIRAVLGRRLLGRHDALSREQVHARAGRRHGRDVRPRAAAGELGRRLGPVEADGRARLHPGDAAARPPREPDPPDRLRQPAEVLQPEPELRLHAAGSRTRRSRRHRSWDLRLRRALSHMSAAGCGRGNFR